MTAIRVENIVVKRGSVRVLDDISLAVNPGDRIALVGPNGSGKTTLLRAILGLLPLSSGHVLLDGQRVAALTARQRAARLAWLPQQALADEAITTLEFVLAARFRFSEPNAVAHDAARAALSRIGAADWAGRPVTQLSGGEQQRVALAALLAQQADVLLADEPANHLDPAQQVVVWSLLGQIGASGTMIVVTHDVNWVRWLGELSATRMVGLKGGRLVFDVMANDASLPERLNGLYGIEMDVFEANGGRVFIPGTSARSVR